MPTPSAQLGLPQIAGTDSPDVPRDINALIARFEAIRNTYASLQVRDVGDVGQIRAGRPLTVADFTGIGLATPLLLANLTTLAGAGSNLGSGGNLTNKGAVVTAPGIRGAAGEAAQFAGSTAQALYITDTGAADPFRIRTGSWGSWFRAAKRGVGQGLISKWPSVAGQRVFYVELSINNALTGYISTTGSDVPAAAGVSDVCDDRWHFVVVSYDGTRIRMYLDGAPEGSSAAVAGSMFSGSGPFNIGGSAADAATATSLPMYGRVDEAFLLSDVLSDDQVRYLYCASLAHIMPVTPKRLWLGVRRQKRGGPLVIGDFPSTPSRLYNFTAGAVANEASDANGAAGSTATLLPNPGTGVIADIAGPDGKAASAKNFSGAHTGLSATDAGLPAALTPRSYGIWLKTVGANASVVGWGTTTTGGAEMKYQTTGGILAQSGADTIVGPRVDDGLWHHVFVVEDNAAADGVKRKLYLDGRVVGGSTVMNTITLAGANRFRIGAAPDGTAPFTGQLARPSVFSGALTSDQVRALYNKGSQALGYSPKAGEDHVEEFEPVRGLVVFDALEACDLVDLAVTA